MRRPGRAYLFAIRLPGFGRVPVIALTGQTSQAAMLRTLEVGFDAYLVKPVSGDALTAQVLRVLGRG